MGGVDDKLWSSHESYKERGPATRRWTFGAKSCGHRGNYLSLLMRTSCALRGHPTTIRPAPLHLPVPWYDHRLAPGPRLVLQGLSTSPTADLTISCIFLAPET
jgi:hypothetical protein